jgi:hypothetical protein
VALATGVALSFVGLDSKGTMRGLHKASSIAWIGFTALHVLGHLPDQKRLFSSSEAVALSTTSLRLDESEEPYRSRGP